MTCPLMYCRFLDFRLVQQLKQRVLNPVNDWIVDWNIVFIPVKNIADICTRRHCRFWKDLSAVRFRYRVTYTVIQRVVFCSYSKDSNNSYKQFLLITVVKPNHTWVITDDVMINLTLDDKDVSYPELLKWTWYWLHTNAS